MKNYLKILLLLIVTIAFGACEKETIQPDYLPTEYETFSKKESISEGKRPDYTRHDTFSKLKN